jgi:hypothetical protein
MKHIEEGIPADYLHPCAQLLQLLALCPSVSIPWTLFDGGPNGEGNVICRGSRVELHGFVKATANNGRRGRVMEVHQDGTTSVVFGCDVNYISSVKPGAEVSRFKQSNVRLAGVAGAHEELLGLKSLQRKQLNASSSSEEHDANDGSGAPLVSEMHPALHDPQELKKIAEYFKELMPTIVQVDEVRRCFSMHSIVAEDIGRGLGFQVDRMRALLHFRFGQFLDEERERADLKSHSVLREITCVAAALAVTCRRLGSLEGDGWGCGMLLRIFETARETWGGDSLVTNRCLTLSHAVLVADLCQQWLSSHSLPTTITAACIKDLAAVPSVREILDACVGPFNFMRALRTYLNPNSDGSKAAVTNRLTILSWRYRTLRGSVETDEKLLSQIEEVLSAQSDPAVLWEMAVVQLTAMTAAGMRLSRKGLVERAIRMYEVSLERSVKLLGAQHPQTLYLKLLLLAQQNRVAGASGASSLDSLSRSGLGLAGGSQGAPTQEKEASCI